MLRDVELVVLGLGVGFLWGVQFREWLSKVIWQRLEKSGQLVVTELRDGVMAYIKRKE